MESRRDDELLKDDGTRVAPEPGPDRPRVDRGVYGFSELGTFGDDGNDGARWDCDWIGGDKGAGLG